MIDINTQVTINDVIPDGVLVGSDESGSVITVIEFAPTYEIVMGTPDDGERVVEWHVCAAHGKRIAAVSAWRDTGNNCLGNA